ncbi:MAG TPA: nuclear transport factor 2 family protein [Polyangia bacterium]
MDGAVSGADVLGSDVDNRQRLWSLAGARPGGVRRLLSIVGLLSVGSLFGGCLSPQPMAPALGGSDTSAATADAVTFFESFFTARNQRDVEATMSHFAPELAAHVDATHGLERRGYEALRTHFAEVMPKWPADARAYPTRIIGSGASAVVGYVEHGFDGAFEVMSPELRRFAAVDFKDGNVVRWVDYWDSSALTAALDAQLRAPAERFAADFHETSVGENASPLAQMVAKRFFEASTTARAEDLTKLFSDEAVYEDLTLRTQLVGRSAIGRYFARALGKLPFATGAQLRHVLGGDAGGAFEWRGSGPSGVPGGLTVFVLDGSARVIRLSIVYDGRRLMQSDRQLLARLALEP